MHCQSGSDVSLDHMLEVAGKEQQRSSPCCVQLEDV